ncbi:MAG TPA: hypothetical protein VJ485_04880 [archaeon]|nr:hypothetical protein [archaeon]
MAKTEKFTIIDDCLVPDRFVWLYYTGPNPWGVARHISARIRDFFHVSASGTNNTRINWDVVGENINFYSVWWVKKNFSGYTTMYVDMKVIGKKSKATNQGNFTLQMNGRLQTEFSGWIRWARPLWTIYSYLLYHRARRKMIERCRNNIMNFREDIKKHFNLQTAESVPTATGTYG